MNTQRETREMEIEGMETQSSLPAKVEELKDIQPIPRLVENQETGEFDKVMISPEEVRQYLTPTATLQELYMFMSICRHQGLDPVSEAYFVKYGGNPGYTVMKYTVYLKRAMASGVLKSIRHEFDDEENPTKITVYIERTDLVGEWAWTTYRAEVEQHRKKDGKVTEIWRKQLRFMMTKCGYSQGLRFFCADVVGALPPVREEMMGIPALNMESQVQREEVVGEILEVKEVKPLPEHLDMGPLRDTYFGMITGMFASNEDRHEWQEEKTGIARMSGKPGWGPAEYGKAFKALSQEAGPPNGTQEQEESSESETSEEETKIPDGADFLSKHRERYVERIAGRFTNPQDQEDWQEKTIGKPDIDSWFAPDFIMAMGALDEEDLAERTTIPNGKLHSPTEELRKEYAGLVSDVFDTKEIREKWQEMVVGEADESKWDPDQYKTAILEIRDYIEADPSREINLALGMVLEIYKNTAATEPMMTGKITEIGETELTLTGESGAAAFNIPYVKRLLKAGVWKFGESTEPTEDSKGKGDTTTETDQTNTDEPESMTKDQFKALKTAVGQLPKYSQSMGSIKFRDRAEAIVGRRVRRVMSHTFDEAKELIMEFQDELTDYLNEQRNNPKEETDLLKK